MSFHLDNTLGATYIGATVAVCLYGISVVQTLYYFTHQQDRWPIKTLVAAVMLSDTVHQALISQFVYAYLVTAWGDPEQLGIVPRSGLVEVIFNTITAFLVQSFLTLRVWHFSRNKFFVAIIALLVLAQFVISNVFAFMSLKYERYTDLDIQLGGIPLSNNIMAMTGDVLIAGALCFYLHRARTGYVSTDTMINRLILFAVNTSLLTSLCAIGSFIAYVVAKDTTINVAIYFCTGRLYTNSLLATLNARELIRRGSGHVLDNTISMSDKVTLTLGELSTTSKRGANDTISMQEFVNGIGHENENDKVDTDNFQTSDRPIAKPRFSGKAVV